MRKNDFHVDLDSRRKSILYRSSNLGMLELDLLVGKFAKNNFQNLSEEDCDAYETQILS